MQHWFVYYKLPRAAVAEVAPCVRIMMGALAAATGVHGRLMQRSADREGIATLMEQYDRVADPASFEAALADAVEHARLPAELRQQRCVERFEDV